MEQFPSDEIDFHHIKSEEINFWYTNRWRFNFFLRRTFDKWYFGDCWIVYVYRPGCLCFEFPLFGVLKVSFGCSFLTTSEAELSSWFLGLRGSSSEITDSLSVILVFNITGIFMCVLVVRNRKCHFDMAVPGEVSN